MKNNYGKRMVKEALIKKIVTDATQEQVAESIAEATASIQESMPYDYMPYVLYTYTRLPREFESLDAWKKYVPYLKTKSLTDADDLAAAGYTIIDTSVDDYNANKRIRFKGFFKLRNTATNTDYYYGTCNSNNIFAESGDVAFGDYIIERIGNNGVEIKYARFAGVTNGGVETNPSVVKITRSNYYVGIQLDSTKIDIGATLTIRMNKVASGNLATTVPTTEGAYLLKVTVNAEGAVGGVSWVAEADYKNV